jgi:hypothetical protein
MVMNQFLSSSRKALSAVPMIFALLMGTSLLMATTPAAAAKKGTPTASTSVVTTVVSGAVTGDQEKVFFRKVNVNIASRLIVIEDGTKKVSLDIAFVKPEGIGATTKDKYLSTYTDPNLLKLLPDAGVVLKLEQTFAFGKEPKDHKQPLSEDQFGLLSLTLYIDGNGVITHAEGSIGDLPVFE